jgi:hypothetical protein
MLVDAGVMMHGYAAVMRQYQIDISRVGSSEAKQAWKNRLARLSATRSYALQNWRGDLFEKANPLWRNVGITKPNLSGAGLSVMSNGATRAVAGRVLSSLLSGLDSTDLQDLVL